MQTTCCQLCQSEVGVFHVVREMAQGTREEFLYFQCSTCDCLSLVKPPLDPERYYTQELPDPKSNRYRAIRNIRNAIYLSPLSFLVNWKSYADLDIIRRLKITKKMSLLYTGCGGRSLVRDLRELGYNAQGIDPHLSTALRDRFGTCSERLSLNDIREPFDILLLRNTIEQMPIGALHKARKITKDDGTCVVCIPLLGWGWKTYTTDWVQLNAPRHLFIHSTKSFERLARDSGFRIENVVFDSTEFQFWASESYQQGVSLEQLIAPTRAQRKRIKVLARSLNRKHQGDCAQFYLRPV